MENISKHITYAEAIRSDSAKRLEIDNIPTAAQLANMKSVAENVFEKVREHFDTQIYISSFFRCQLLNKAIGGVSSSQHCTGCAMDIDADQYGGTTNRKIFDYIKDNLDFDQLIAENVDSNNNIAWVHCSYVNTEKNRREVLLMRKVNGKTVYEKYKD